jgi:hypothetical protein
MFSAYPQTPNLATSSSKLVHRINRTLVVSWNATGTDETSSLLRGPRASLAHLSKSWDRRY